MITRLLVLPLIVLLPFHAVVKFFIPNEFVGTYWKEGFLAAMTMSVATLFVVGHHRRRFVRRIRKSRLVIPLSVYCGVILLRFALSPDLLGMWGLYFYFSYFLLFLAVVYTFDLRHLELVFKVLSYLGGLIGLLVMLDYVLDLSPYQWVNEGEWWIRELGFRRARYPFASPLVASAFLSVTAALGYQGIIRKTVARRNRAALFVMLALNLGGLVATFSRGGWVALAISVALIGLLQRYPRIPAFRSRSITLGVPMIVIVGGLLVVSGQASALIERAASIFSPTEAGNAERLISWGLSLQAFLSAPLFGIGLGRTGARATGISQDAFVTESYVLQHLVEMGLVGLLAYLLFFGAVIQLGLRMLKQLDDSALRAQAVASISVIVSLFVYSAYLQVLQMREVAMLFWLLVGVLVLSADLGEENEERIDACA